ncbi:uncharacterized protein LOC127367333 isoform X2 [Dicentrarchus labrax]|nr:uncharacterized protein LOC127367333 isoform X2 [Dicentrarchus labrax]
MNLDTESAAHTGMECQSRSSHKYLLLQVWCGLLTVTMVVMAVFLTSIKTKSTQDEVSTLKPDVSTTGNTIAGPLKSIGSSFSYIQLISPDMHSWQNDIQTPKCQSCHLDLRDNFIFCMKDSLYFIYAQVTFSKHANKSQSKSVILKKNASFGRRERILVEGTLPHTTEGSVWVAKIVKLTEGDSVSINITDYFRTYSTFWGAYELHSGV